MNNKEAWYWLNKDSRKFLQGYFEEDPIERVKEIGRRFEKINGTKGIGDKFVEFMSKGWASLASPVWSNYGRQTGLPISCFGSYIDDSVESILYKTAEIGTMTKAGGGTSAFLGAIRPMGSSISVGGKADGPMKFAELLQATTSIISQGTTRKGHTAVYLPIEHLDSKYLLRARDVGNPIQDLSFGVSITDEFMESLEKGDEKNRALWLTVLRKRMETGFPYIFWHDTVNRDSPFEETIYASNMCTEIALPSNKDLSFVCCLSSVNLLHWDDWKDTDFVETMILFLDTVMQEFIEKTEGVLFWDSANAFAKKYRALGLGALGWHDFLQSKMVPFESLEAQYYNNLIWKTIREQAEKGRRGNATLLAIAPTTSSSFILGQVSPSIEPLLDNYFTKDLAKGKFTYKNPALQNLLRHKGQDAPNVWLSILERGGSVAHLDFLTDYEKSVFKTYGEISQAEIITQAAQRQKYIDQSQSINLMIHPDAPLKDVNTLMMTAWRMGLKTLYYQRSTNPSQALIRNLLDCSSCEA